jgi:diguanylate cyclase (GGDEF)-like protein/PAS domain S-box-containing protein
VSFDWQPAVVIFAHDVTEYVATREELHETQQWLGAAQPAASWVAWEWHVESDDLHVSAFADHLFNLDVQAAAATGEEFLAHVHPKDRDRFRRSIEDLIKNDSDLICEIRCVTPNGEIRWLSESAVAIRDPSGRAQRVVGIAHDITQQKVAENALFQEQDRALVTLSSIADGVIRTDNRGVIDYLNPVAQRMTGWSLSEAFGRPVADIYQVVDEETGFSQPGPVEQCLDNQRETVFRGQRVLLRRDGDRFPVHDSAAPIRDRNDRMTGTILVFRDLSQVKRVEEEMHHLATHDPLTGLLNRRHFEASMQEIYYQSTGSLSRQALCHLNLDAFKLVNDTCGQAAGDQLIRQIASLLQDRVSQHDLVARLGGDEFGILFRDCSPSEADQGAQDICDAIHSSRFHWEGKTFTPRVSMGLALMSAAATGPDALLSAADAACYVAKDRGGGRIHVFQPGDTAIAERHGEMQWITRIHQAFDDDRFCLWHQTIQPLKSGSSEPPFSELFIRLIDEDGEVVAPGSFVPAAERYGLIDSIDRWVVHSAVNLLLDYSHPLMSDKARFAINISGQSLGADGFLDYIIDEFDRTGISPERVLFEITETSAIANLRKAMRFITVLKEIGCLFVLDDFGQGLSSFGYLKNLPLDYLKIDGEFVREMVDDPIQAALVNSIREIGEVMGLRTIAESVEDEATLDALSKIGVDYAQGYYLARPQPFGASLPPMDNH